MKHIYMKPSLEIVDFKEPLMDLELPVSNGFVEEGDEAAKEQGEFVEEDAVPTSPNIWGDTEEED
jgi:hypothetical protein